MPSAATIIVDDQDPNLNYLCPILNERVTGSYYKNTWTSPQNSSCFNGWFQYTFNGTGVQVPTSFANASDFPVRIDNNDFLLYTGNGTYDSPTLSDGQHTITYAMGNLSVFPALDYLTVTAGPNTMLYGKTIAVDDTDKSISFRGSWSQSSQYPPSTPVDYVARLYQNTAHWTSTIGDTMEFSFEGNSLAIYGMVAYSAIALRNITTDFIIDGVAQTRTTISNKTSPYLPMVELFRADLGDGNHTLLFNLSDIDGDRALGIDFVTYNATFNYLTPASNSSPSWALKLGIALASIAGFALLLTLGIIFWQRFRKDRHHGQKYVQQTA
jgi:hypothetical protein